MSEHTEDSHYVKIWAILCVLLVVSVVGPFVGDATGIQVITLITAFGIAFVKAYIVAKNFMHLNVEKRIVHYFLATVLMFVVLFFSATAPDIMKQDGSNWVKTYDFTALQASCCEHNNIADCRLAGLQVEVPVKDNQNDHQTKISHHKNEIRCVQCLGLPGYPDDPEKCHSEEHSDEAAAHSDKPAHSDEAAHSDKPAHSDEAAHSDKPAHSEAQAHGDDDSAGDKAGH